LEMTTSEFTWPRRRKNRNGKKKGDDDGGESGGGSKSGNVSSSGSRMWPTMSSMATRYRSRSRTRDNATREDTGTGEVPRNERTTIRFLQPPLWPARPPHAVTPVSRTETTSADSTVYAVRYHPLTETTSRSSPPPPPSRGARSRSSSSASDQSHNNDGVEPRSAITPEPSVTASQAPSSSANNGWRAIMQANQLFRRATTRSTTSGDAPRSPGHDRRPHHDNDAGRWDLRARLEDFTVSQAEKLRERIRPTPDTERLPVTVIPAPPRRGAALAQLLEEEGNERHSGAERPSAQVYRTDSSASRSSAARPTAATLGPASPRLWRSDSGASAASMTRPRPWPSPVSAREPPPLATRASDRRSGELAGGSLQPQQSSSVASRRQSAADGSPHREGGAA